MFGHLREKCKFLNPNKVDTPTPAKLDEVLQQEIAEGVVEKMTQNFVDEGSNPVEGVSKTLNSDFNLVDTGSNPKKPNSFGLEIGKYPGSSLPDDNLVLPSDSVPTTNPSTGLNPRKPNSYGIEMGKDLEYSETTLNFLVDHAPDNSLASNMPPISR